MSDFTKVGIDLINAAKNLSRPSAVALLEEFIEGRLTAGANFTVRVLLAGGDPEVVQEWLAENE